MDAVVPHPKKGWLQRAAIPALRLIFVISVTALSWFSMPAAVVAISASILVALHSKASTLIELSFGPLKAKLQRDVTEAEKLVDKLRRLGVLQAKSVIAASVRAGRWASTDDWLYQNVRTMETALRDMGVSEDDLREVRKELIRFTVLDMGGSAMGRIYVPTSLGGDAVEEWQALAKQSFERGPDDIETFLKRWGALTPERQLRIDDMRWLLAHGDIKDRDQYLRSQQPIEWDRPS